MVLATLLALLALGSRQAWADPRDDARRHTYAGFAAAQNQDYEKALEEFLIAQELYPHPKTLYNIGRAYADLGRLDEAIRYYRLARESDPELASLTDPIIAVLEARLRRAQAPPESPPEGGTASATRAEVERLQQIADELARLSRDLATREEGPSAPPPEEAPPPVEEEIPVALPEEDAFLTEAYERVVVTASRYGQDPIESPSTVTILTQDDIRLSGASNIPDLLRRVVGVDVMSLSSAQPDVSIRGFNREMSNKVLVLIDGRSVYIDLLASPVWGMLPISLEEIERIEIIRGPGSAVYGANAMTGVINIITRTPGTGQNLVSIEGGSPGYTQGTALVSGRSGDTAWRFSGGGHQVGRWARLAPDSSDSPLDFTTEDRDLSLRTIRADGRIDRAFGEEGFASVSGGYVEGFTEFYVLGALGDYAMDFRSSYARGDIAWGPVHLRGFWNQLSGNAAPWFQYAGLRDQSTPVDSDVLDFELEGNGRFETGALEHRFNVGAGYRYKLVEWGYLEGGGSPIEEHHLNAFGQDQVTAGRLSITGSLRVDRHPLVDISRTISPRGAVVARLADRTALRLTGGTSFRAPSQMESYLDLNQNTDVDAIYVRTLGNRELLPERVVTGEVGLHDESTAFHRLDVVGFVNRVTNLIYVQDVVPQVAPYNPLTNGFPAGSTQFGNLEPAYTGVGIEVDTRFFPTDGLDVYANANVQRIYENTGGTSEVDASTSAFKLNLGVMYRSPWRLDVALHDHFVSAQTWGLRSFSESGDLITRDADLPARNILVGRVAIRPTPDEALELGLTAWNLGEILSGNTFREHPEGQPVSSRLYGTMIYRF